MKNSILKSFVIVVLKTYLIISGLIIALTFYKADYKQISIVESPNKIMTAKVTSDEYVSMFTPPYYSVRIRSNHWWGGLNEKKLFEVENINNALPPQVKWLDNNNLVIIKDLKDDKITLQTSLFEGIKISYELNKE